METQNISTCRKIISSLSCQTLNLLRWIAQAARALFHTYVSKIEKVVMFFKNLITALMSHFFCKKRWLSDGHCIDLYFWSATWHFYIPNIASQQHFIPSWKMVKWQKWLKFWGGVFPKDICIIHLRKLLHMIINILKFSPDHKICGN